MCTSTELSIDHETNIDFDISQVDEKKKQILLIMFIVEYRQ